MKRKVQLNKEPLKRIPTTVEMSLPSSTVRSATRRNAPTTKKPR